MELKLLFYILLGIGYLFFSIYKGRNKAKTENGERPEPTGKKGWEQELEDILRRTIQPEQPVTPPAPRPAVKTPVASKKPKTTFLDEEMTGYLKQQEEEQKNHFQQENYSIEYDSSPVFAHKINEEGMISSSEKPASVGARILEEEPFDARKAFLYSEIFYRKY